MLIVEDEAIVGMLIEDILSDEGCRISGPHLSLAAGLAAARTQEVDLAILDVNLAGERSYPIGEALAARGIPFVLTSGYGDDAAPQDHPDWPVCSKPFASDILVATLKSLIAPDPAQQKT